MGLDTVIVAFFAVGTILVVAGTLTMGTTNLIESSYDGYISTSQTVMERLHTDIAISGMTFDEGSSHVHFTVTNTGETKLDNFDLWDVIVVKDSQASYFAKDSGYTITFNGDLLNPGILDPGESIDIELLTPFNLGDSILVKVSTENGIGSSGSYSIGG